MSEYNVISRSIDSVCRSNDLVMSFKQIIILSRLNDLVMSFERLSMSFERLSISFERTTYYQHTMSSNNLLCRSNELLLFFKIQFGSNALP